jgi:hypothetical protein
MRQIGTTGKIGNMDDGAGNIPASPSLQEMPPARDFTARD